MTLGRFAGLNPGIYPSKSAQRRRARLPPGRLRGREGGQQRGRARGPGGRRRARPELVQGGPRAPLPPARWLLLWTRARSRGQNWPWKSWGGHLAPSPDLSVRLRQGAVQNRLGRAPLPDAQRPLPRAWPRRSLQGAGTAGGVPELSRETRSSDSSGASGSPGLSREGQGRLRECGPREAVGQERKGLARSGTPRGRGRGRGGVPRGCSGREWPARSPWAAEPLSGGPWGRPQAPHT